MDTDIQVAHEQGQYNSLHNMVSTTKHQNGPTILQLPGDGSLGIRDN